MLKVLCELVIVIMGYEKYRNKELSESVRLALIREFTHGSWSSVQEFGDRNNKDDEPCVMCLNSKVMRYGLFPYQAAYLLFYGTVPPKGNCISHRCRNARNKKSTRCCTVSHMLIKTQKENRSRFKDHEKIKTKAKSMMQSQSDQLVGPVKIDTCKHKGPKGNEYCLINYCENKQASDSVQKYILKNKD